MRICNSSGIGDESNTQHACHHVSRFTIKSLLEFTMIDFAGAKPRNVMHVFDFARRSEVAETPSANGIPHLIECELRLIADHDQFFSLVFVRPGHDGSGESQSILWKGAG